MHGEASYPGHPTSDEDLLVPLRDRRRAARVRLWVGVYERVLGALMLTGAGVYEFMRLFAGDALWPW